MNLDAYMNIDRLEEIAQKNNIVIPRLRGYQLMSEEEPFPVENMEQLFKDVEVEKCEELITAMPLYAINSTCHRFDKNTDKKKEKYIKGNKVLWNNIHGKFRKNLKFAIKIQKKAIKNQFDTFNKYVGRKDIMMVHARVGGDNWEFFDCHKTVATQPWFIEKVDDCFDSTYCDIYVKIS